MARRPAGGSLAAALGAWVLDYTKVEAAPACRAVVSDDGTEIRLTLYSDAGAVASVVLDTARAVALAGRLIEAALSRLSS